LNIKGQELKRFTMPGQKLRELREAKGLVQRQVPAEPEVDTTNMSKLESNERSAIRQHLKKLSVLLSISKDELLTLWLADKLYDIAKEEEVGLKAIEAAEVELKTLKRKKNR
jgi:transcriptional regulator with XRE-family HTH domain